MAGKSDAHMQKEPEMGTGWGKIRGHWTAQGVGGIGSVLEEVRVNCIFEQLFCTQHTQWKEMPHRLWFWWLKNLNIFHLPSPCPQRTTTSYPLLHPHLLLSRLNFFEVNRYNRQEDVEKEWNLSHTSLISIKLQGSWKIKGKDLGAKHILGFTEPHFGFPNPGLGRSTRSARLWSKLFQGWNQLCGVGDPQTKVGVVGPPSSQRNVAIAFYECFHFYEIRNLPLMTWEQK